MSSINEESNYIPRKLNPYENELQFEYKRLNTAKSSGLSQKINIQQMDQNMQTFNLIKKYPDKLNEIPIYDPKSQQIFIIQDQGTDNEHEKEQSMQFENKLNKSSRIPKEQQLNELQEGSFKQTPDVNITNSPIDLRKIQFQEEDLKKQQNLDNIILEIDKNERAIKKLKYMWPYSNLENHKLSNMQGYTNRQFEQNEETNNLTIINKHNMQWDDFDQSPCINSQKKTKYKLQPSIYQDKKNSQNYLQNQNEKQENNNDKFNDEILNTLSFQMTQNKQYNLGDSKNYLNNCHLKQDDNQSSTPQDNTMKCSISDKNLQIRQLTEQKDYLEPQESLRNVLLRQTTSKFQDLQTIYNQQPTTSKDRQQLILQGNSYRYSRSRSKSRNGQHNIYHIENDSIKSHQVSPKIYDKNLKKSQSIEKNNVLIGKNMQNIKHENKSKTIEETLQNMESKKISIFDNEGIIKDNNLHEYNCQDQYQTFESKFKNEIYNENQRVNNYQDQSRKGNQNVSTKKQNTIYICENDKLVNKNRKDSLKNRILSRAQSRQRSKQANNIGQDNQRNFSSSRVKTQQDQHLPRLQNIQIQKTLKTESNSNNETINNMKKEFKSFQKDLTKKDQNEIELQIEKIRFSDPFIQKQLMEFENEQKSQNNEIDEKINKQKQSNKQPNQTNYFTQTSKGNRQFRTLEDKRNIKTSQNTHRTLDQLKNDNSNKKKIDLSPQYDNKFKIRKNSEYINTFYPQRVNSKKEVRSKTPVDNKIRYSQNDQLKEILRNKSLKQKDKDKKQLLVELNDIQKNNAIAGYQRSKTTQNNSDGLENIFFSSYQIDKDLLKKQQLLNILNNKDIDNFIDYNLIGINDKYDNQTFNSKKQDLKNINKNEIEKNDNKEIDKNQIFDDIEKRKSTLKLNDKEKQNIYNYGDYTIIHHPKQKSRNLLGVDENNQIQQNCNEEFEEQVNQYLDMAIDYHKNSQKKLQLLEKYKAPLSPQTPTINHLNNITNNYKIKKKQQRSKSVLNNEQRIEYGTNQSSSKKIQKLDLEEQKYKIICKRISEKMTYIPEEYSGRSEQFLRDLLAELNVCNPIFSNISYFTGINILRLSRIYVYEVNTNVYVENQPSDSAFLILYGRVSLRSKSNGEFKESIMGETIGEEAVLGSEDQKINRFESALIVDETSMCEINREFIEKFRIICADKGLLDDYTSLITFMKKNFIQKKTLRLMNIKNPI